MALKSISINGNFDWSPFEEYKNYLICFNSNDSTYSNNNNINNYIYLLDINFNSDCRNLEIVSKLNFDQVLKEEQEESNNNVSNEFVTCFEWINSSNFVEEESERELNKGIIVGGMTNGDIVLLSPQNLFEKNIDYENILLNKVNVHDNCINCLEFNRHKNHLIATGGNDGQLFITDIENLYSPTSYDPYLDKTNLHKITCLNWNKKVSHILATSSNNGNTIIWDLKIKKSAVSFKDPHSRTKISSLCWLANQPTQILVSYDDDRNPCLQLWDLRNSNYPIKEIIGHSKGINNICFSNIDNNLLLSSGKDTTKCWYLNNNNFDIFNEITNSSNNIYSKWSPFIPDVFASSTNMGTIQINSIHNGNKMSSKYIPSFYKKDAGVCFGFGGKICFFNNITSSASLPNPVSQCSSKNDDIDTAKLKNKMYENNKFLIKCHIYPTEIELISEADHFEKYITSGNYKEFCERKIMKSDDDNEKLTWKILQLLCTSQRSEIVKELGYDMNSIIQKIMYNVGKKPGFLFESVADKDLSTNGLPNNFLENNGINYNSVGISNNNGNIGLVNSTINNNMNSRDNINAMQMINDQPQSHPHPSSHACDDNKQLNGYFDVDPEKFFRELGEKTENEKLKKNLSFENNLENENGYSNSNINNSNSNNSININGSIDNLLENKDVGSDWNSGTESIIKECVLVGNIETAVELCLYKNRMADALLLSSFVGQDLWNKTKAIYISKQNDSFLRNFSYILDNKLDLLVNNINLSSWGEALSILCTYAINNPNFNVLCETLAKRLQNEKFDIRAASICYLCACNFSETVEIWNNMPPKKASFLNALQDLVEKMTVLKMVIKFDQYNPIMNQKINQYAELLANSGRLKAAMTFLYLIQDDNNLESLILRDRIFNSANYILDNKIEPPILPFQVIDVKPSLVVHQHQAYAQGQQFAQGQHFKPNLSRLSSSPTLQQTVPPPQSNQGPLRSGNFISKNINKPFSTSSLSNITNKTFASNNLNTAQNSANAPSYIAPPNIPFHAPPTNNLYLQSPKNSNFSSSQNIQGQEKQHPSLFNQPFTNINKPSPNNPLSSNNALPFIPSVTSPLPSQLTSSTSHALNQINESSDFSKFQRNISVLPNSNPAGSIPNFSQFNINQFQENQFNKREYYDNQMYGSDKKLPAANVNVVPPNNFQTSFQDNANKEAFKLQSGVESSLGSSTTSPIAGALTITPGMPVPWPIPTTTQQLGSTTNTTANENKKIQTATKEQSGVLMSKSNIELVKTSINNLLNAYVSQEPIKKRSHDITSKVYYLFEKLDNGSFNDKINDNLINLCNFINANDFINTNKLIVDLSRNLWDSNNKSWIMGLKHIIPR